MSLAIEKPSYKLINIVFSKSEPFTLDDIKDDLNEIGINGNNNDDIKSALNRLRNKGIIIKHGSYYSLYKKEF